ARTTRAAALASISVRVEATVSSTSTGRAAASRRGSSPPGRGPSLFVASIPQSYGSSKPATRPPQFLWITFRPPPEMWKHLWRNVLGGGQVAADHAPPSVRSRPPPPLSGRAA